MPPVLAPSPRFDQAWSHIAFIVVLCFGGATALAYWHAGPSAWIQSVYFVAAALPLSTALVNLDRFRTHGDPRARRMFAYHFAMAVSIGLYAEMRLRGHWRDLAVKEAELEPALKVITQYRSQHGRYPAGMPPLPDDVSRLRRLHDANLKYDYQRISDEEFDLSFMHSITRKHVFHSKTGLWDDAD